MGLFRKPAVDSWAKAHPYGDEGSVDYWLEAMKRAYQLGEMRAAGEIERLAGLTGPQPPRPFTTFPLWFHDLWMDSLASYNKHSCHLAMPY